LEKNKKKRFHWRGTTSFLLVLGLLVETVSGIILYVTPFGRYARWNNWTLLGLDKWEWAAVHTIFAILLLIIIGAHLYFNWRVIVHFVWSRLRNAVNLKWELAVSLAITIFLFTGTILNIPPFSSVMNLREKAKLSWEKGDVAVQRGRYGRRYLMNNVEYMKQNRRQENIGSRRNGYGRRARLNTEYFSAYEWTLGSSMNRYGRGRGLGRRTSEIGRSENVSPTTLKGRDIARLGQSTTLKGILMQIGEEWGLKVGDTVYAIHLGPREYRTSKRFFLKEGQRATVKGFAYKTNVAVTRIETGGKSIMLRDETGRPAWAGTNFGKGNRSGN
jgi:hypothetical protein